MNRTAQHVEDELLVLRCQAMEGGAFEALVRRWRQPLLGYAGALLGAFDHERDDAAQEAWIAIAKGLGRLEDPARFRAWAYRILTNKCADLIARKRRDRKLVAHAAESAAPEATSDSENGDVDALRLAITQLDFDRQAMLRMFYVEELSIEEIGQVLAIPAGTVKSRLHHTRQKLRAMLEAAPKETDHGQLTR